MDPPNDPGFSRFDLERNVDAGGIADIYVPGTTFSEWVTPSSNWWDGSPSHLTIDDIRFMNNGRISFRASVK